MEKLVKIAICIMEKFESHSLRRNPKIIAIFSWRNKENIVLFFYADIQKILPFFHADTPKILPFFKDCLYGEIWKMLPFFHVEIGLPGLPIIMRN